MMDVVSPITFVTDPIARIAVAAAVAEVSKIPEDWIVVYLKRKVKRWLEALYNISDKVRRLLTSSVQVDYVIVVPANNMERQTGMGALEAMMRQPLWNITKVVRFHVHSAIGTPAGIEVTARTQPSLGIMEHHTTTTTTVTATNRTGRGIGTSRAPSPPSLVAAVSATIFCWLNFATFSGS